MADKYNDTPRSSRLIHLYDVAKMRKSRIYSLWSKYEKIVFSDKVNDYLSANMPTPHDNELYPTLSSLVAHMLDQKQGISISSINEPTSPYAEFFNTLASDLNSTINAAWRNYNWDATFQELVWDAAIYGAGICKSTWNSSLASGKGDVEFTRINPWAFYPDPQAKNLTDGNYYIEMRRMSRDEIKRKFPELAKKIMDMPDTLDDEDTDYGSGQTSLPRADISLLPTGQPGSYGLPGQSGGYVADDMGITIMEIWLRDLRKRPKNSDPDDDTPKSKSKNKDDDEEIIYEDRWRCVLIARNQILLDEWAEDIYGFNNHPYSRFVFDEIGKFYPPSLAHFLCSPQIAIHRLLASIQQNAELTGNPIFMDTSNSGIDRTTIVNRPGQRLTVNSGSAGNPPQWLTPPSVPQYVMDLLQFWIGRIENISGLSGSVKGMAPQPRTADKSVQSAAESAFVRVRNGLRNMEMTLNNAMGICGELIIQNYDQERVVAYSDSTATTEVLALREEHFYVNTSYDDDDKTPLQFYVAVDLGSDAMTSRSARVSNAITLFTIGGVDQKYLLEELRIKDAEKVIARMLIDPPPKLSQRQAARK
jgi:hypothetical protein